MSKKSKRENKKNVKVKQFIRGMQGNLLKAKSLGTEEAVNFILKTTLNVFNEIKIKKDISKDLLMAFDEYKRDAYYYVINDDGLQKTDKITLAHRILMFEINVGLVLLKKDAKEFLYIRKDNSYEKAVAFIFLLILTEYSFGLIGEKSETDEKIMNGVENTLNEKPLTDYPVEKSDLLSIVK